MGQNLTKTNNTTTNSHVALALTCDTIVT